MWKGYVTADKVTGAKPTATKTRPRAVSPVAEVALAKTRSRSSRDKKRSQTRSRSSGDKKRSQTRSKSSGHKKRSRAPVAEEAPKKRSRSPNPTPKGVPTILYPPVVQPSHGKSALPPSKPQNKSGANDPSPSPHPADVTPAPPGTQEPGAVPRGAGTGEEWLHSKLDPPQPPQPPHNHHDIPPYDRMQPAQKRVHEILHPGQGHLITPMTEHAALYRAALAPWHSGEESPQIIVAKHKEKQMDKMLLKSQQNIDDSTSQIVKHWLHEYRTREPQTNYITYQENQIAREKNVLQPNYKRTKDGWSKYRNLLKRQRKAGERLSL